MAREDHIFAKECHISAKEAILIISDLFFIAKEAEYKPRKGYKSPVSHDYMPRIKFIQLNGAYLAFTRGILRRKSISIRSGKSMLTYGLLEGMILMYLNRPLR
ncbi:MAG: hypothetical protein RIC06_01195 [Cyclobacteriaceae bacterium]